MIWPDVALILIVALLLMMLFWMGAIFYAIQKGFNQVVRGLESIDDRLKHLGKKG